MNTIKQRNALLLYFILAVLFLIISYISIFITGDYKWSYIYMNTYITIIFVLKDVFKSKSILSYGIVFNLFWWMYTNIYVIEILVSNASLTFIDQLLMLLSLIAMISFNIAYWMPLSYFSNKIYVKKSEHNINYNYKKIKFFVIIVFSIAILAQLYVIFLKIGINSFVFTDRSSRSLMLLPFRKFMFYEDLLIVVATISYFLKTYYNDKVIKFIFYASFINSSLLSIITISRAGFIMLVLPILFIALHQKKISNKNVTSLLITILLTFMVWKSVIYSFIFKTPLIIDYSNFTNEFTTWYKIGNNVLSDLLYGNINYEFGKTFLNTFLNLIFPFVNTESLSVWYVKNYEYSTYIRGGGRGFSGVIEGFINFSFLGIIIYFMFIGILFKIINYYKNKDSMYLIIYSISLPYILRIFRAESLSFFKTWWWFYILVIIVIFTLSRAKKDSLTRGNYI